MIYINILHIVSWPFHSLYNVFALAKAFKLDEDQFINIFPVKVVIFLNFNKKENVLFCKYLYFSFTFTSTPYF